MTTYISLNHGSGGRASQQLISKMFLKYFNNEYLNQLTDSAIIESEKSHFAFTTDGYVVEPIFFPGGNIGKLAVCGTVNDLAVTGAIPKFLSTSFIIEEGFSMDDLEKIVATMSHEARQTGVSIVTGDTKVVPKGKCDKIFISTAGIGILPETYRWIASGRKVKIGDKLIINGTVGDHSIAILSARESLQFESSIISDCAPLNHLIQQALDICPDIAFMRDVTRGGLATVVNELAEMTGLGIMLHENSIPVNENTMGICELFGFDPLYLANEGKVLMVVPSEKATEVVNCLKKNEYGKQAAIIGEVVEQHPSKVVLETITGGKRLLEMPTGVLLPRIC